MSKGETDRGPVLCSECGAAAETKEENIRGTKWRPADQRTGGRAKRIKDEKGETRRRNYYWNGVLSGGREVGDECGWILIPVRCCEEFFDGEVGGSVRGKENVGYIV